VAGLSQFPCKRVFTAAGPDEKNSHRLLGSPEIRDGAV
jgi:hypothetical protein